MRGAFANFLADFFVFDRFFALLRKLIFGLLSGQDAGFRKAREAVICKSPVSFPLLASAFRSILDV